MDDLIFKKFMELQASVTSNLSMLAVATKKSVERILRLEERVLRLEVEVKWLRGQLAAKESNPTDQRN